MKLIRAIKRMLGHRDKIKWITSEGKSVTFKELVKSVTCKF